MLGNLAESMMFVSTLALAAVLLPVILAYAARSYIVVVEETASGNDEVQGPDEPFIDWFRKVGYLAFMVAVWLVPLGFVARYMGVGKSPVGLFQDPKVMAVLAVGMWLLFPVELLSSLSTGSPWTIFRGEVVVRMLHRPGAVLAFYLGSAVLVAAAGGAAWLLVGAGAVPLLLLGGPLAAVVFLLHARLLGWLGAHLRTVPLVEESPADAE